MGAVVDGIDPGSGADEKEIRAFLNIIEAERPADSDLTVRNISS
jgi:hypothetical protein